MRLSLFSVVDGGDLAEPEMETEAPAEEEGGAEPVAPATEAPTEPPTVEAGENGYRITSTI